MIIGKADNAVRDWLGNKVRFADLFNGIVYEGEAVIKPEELTQTNNETGMVVKDKEGKEKTVNRRRDVIMNWKGGYNLVVLAVESQKEISYAMPVRNMLYDPIAAAISVILHLYAGYTMSYSHAPSCVFAKASFD